MKAKFITIVLAVFFMSFGTSFGQEITLDNISGTMWHGQPDSIMAGSSYVFNIRFNGNGFDTNIDTTVYGDPASPDSTIIDTIVFSTYTGITNGFRIYSENGAMWTTVVGIDTGNIAGLYTTSAIQHFGTGSVADTVGFASISFVSAGLPVDYNDIAYSIVVGPIPGGATHHGQTICLDSAYFGSSGTWKWATPPSINIFPSWDGPHCYTIVDEATGINGPDGLPNSFSLSQNYPNPFNPSTRINFSLEANSDVTLTIYNITGQKVKEFNGTFEAGNAGYFEWDAAANSSGIYFYKLVAGDFTDTKKMMLLK